MNELITFVQRATIAAIVTIFVIAVGFMILAKSNGVLNMQIVFWLTSFEVFVVVCIAIAAALAAAIRRNSLTEWIFRAGILFCMQLICVTLFLWLLYYTFHYATNERLMWLIPVVSLTFVLCWALWSAARDDDSSISKDKLIEQKLKLFLWCFLLCTVQIPVALIFGVLFTFGQGSLDPFAGFLFYSVFLIPIISATILLAYTQNWLIRKMIVSIFRQHEM